MKASPKADLLYLTHIQDCLERIAEYMQGGREEFMLTPFGASQG